MLAYRILPEHKSARIFQGHISSLSKTFTEITSLSKLTARPILELGSSFDSLKLDFLVNRHLKRRAMERTAFLLGQTDLVLSRMSVGHHSGSYYLRMAAEALEQGTHVRPREHRMFGGQAWSLSRLHTCDQWKY